MGILKDMVKEVREQTLNGNTVKIDDLAIFKCSVESQPVNLLYDATNDIVIKAAIGPKTARAEQGRGTGMDGPGAEDDRRREAAGTLTAS